MNPDLIFGAGSIIFCIALLPSVFSKDKPNLLTSCVTASVLGIFAITYESINFHFAAAVSVVTVIVGLE